MKLKKNDKKHMEKIYNQIVQSLWYIQDLVTEKNEYYADRSERWRESDKGCDFEIALDTLEGIQSNIESVQEQLEDFIQNHMQGEEAK